MNIPNDPNKAFLGVGWAFPPHLETDGTTAEAVYEEDIRQAIIIILSTNPGERVMRPDFGAGLNAFVFEPINSTTLARLQVQVEGALVDWEPRIDVMEVDITPNASNPGRLDIAISYRVRSTNTVANLVYPFYLDEGKPA